MKSILELNFERVGKYYRQSVKEDFFQDIPAKVWNDLDMDEIFLKIDKTQTKYGQQFLYKSLKLVHGGPVLDLDLETTIQSIQQNPNFEAFLTAKLLGLAKNDSYFLCNVFQKGFPNPPAFVFGFYILFAAAIVGIPLAFFFSWLIIPLMVIVTCNFMIHYWGKLNVILDSASFGQLGEMLSVAKAILREANKQNFSLIKSPEVTGINSLIFKTSLFKTRIRGLGEMAEFLEYFTELLKAAFLIEILLYFSLVKQIEKENKRIEANFEATAYLDFALSILNLRRSDQTITVPKESESLILEAKELRHPLLSAAISNTFCIDRNGVLITGANMSGKSTFLRCVGLNCVLAQTINCVYASELTLPKTKLLSSIQNFDELASEKSYFFSEAESLKAMLYSRADQGFELLLIDEIFKGTNAKERLTLSSVILNHLATGTTLVIVTTHDLELADQLSDFLFFYFTGKDINERYCYDYKLRTGLLDTTNAALVLRDMGYPDEILAKISQKQLSERK
jgi:energy-coupling factor transporter ATP-binding protein EcfA2